METNEFKGTVIGIPIEKVLYGDTDAEARLPLPDEVKTILATVTD